MGKPAGQPKKEHNSVLSTSFFNAVGDYSRNTLSQEWVKGTGQNKMQVWEIAKGDLYDFHLTAIMDGTGWNVQKFHFTLRKGPGKGTEAFAWFAIRGLDKDATLGPRENQGDITLFSAPDIPLNIRTHLLEIPKYATEIFALAKKFIK